MNVTNWTPGIIVTVVGAVAAIVILLRTRRAPLTLDEIFALEQRDRLADYERRIQELLEELRELEQDRHHLPPEAFTAEKSRLELEAAKALRERDEFARRMGPERPAPAPAAATGFFARNPALKGALWGAAVVLFFVVLGIVLTQEQKPREDMPPPRDAMGPSEEELAAEKREEEQLQRLVERLNASPDDVQLMTEVAHQMMRRQQFTEAQALTEKALTLDPFQTEARIHKAVLRGLRGDTRAALDDLEAIGRTHPDGVEAWLFAGALAMEVNDLRRALSAFERYAASAPPKDRPPQLEQGLQMLRRQVAQLDGQQGQQQQGPMMGSGTNNDRPPPLTDEQMKAFEQLQQNPEFQAQAQTTLELAEKDLAGGKFQDALDKYKSVMPVLPQSGRAKAGMAWALIGLNRQPMADRVWGVAVQSDPAAVDALGDSLKQLGDSDGAKKVWVKLAESAPSYPGLVAVKKKLQ